MVDESLVGAHLRGDQAGYAAQIVVDDGLAGEAEAFSVCFQTGVDPFIYSADALKFPIFWNFLHFASGCQTITGHFFKIRVGASACPVLVGGRRSRIGSCNGRMQGGVDDGYKTVGVGKLATGLQRHLSPQLIRRQTVRVFDAASHRAVSHQLVQAHAAEALRARCWFFDCFAHTQEQTISGRVAVLVLFICYYRHMGGQRFPISFQAFQNGGAHLVDAAAVLDISFRIHIKAAAERIDLGASLALCLCPACSWGLRCCSWCVFWSGRLCSASVSGAFFWRWYWVLWILFVVYYTHFIFLAFCSLVSAGSHVAVGRHWLEGYL